MLKMKMKLGHSTAHLGGSRSHYMQKYSKHILQIQMHILRIVKNIKIVEQSQKGEWQIFEGGELLNML